MRTGRNSFFGAYRSSEGITELKRNVKEASAWIRNPLRAFEKNNCHKSLLEMSQKELYRYFKK